MLKMRYTLNGKLNGKSIRDYLESGDDFFSPGGFEFECQINGKDVSVQFDWESYEMSLNDDGSVTVRHGEKTLFGGEPELDSCYEESWTMEGITREDITAKVLASTSKIVEFYLDYDANEDSTMDSVEITSLELVDETGTYSVQNTVLKQAGNILRL